MKKSTGRLLKQLLAMLLVFTLFLLAFIVLITLKDFRPAPAISLEIQGECTLHNSSNRTFSIISWNIGYAGLGAEMDFFYEGGERVRPGRDYYSACWEGISQFIAVTDTVDFYLIQEIDQSSKRSYFTDQVSELSVLFNGYCSVFAKNYDVPYIPIPLLGPMGRVVAGMMTYSRYRPVFATRFAYPNIAPWPERLFLLDRCFIETRYPLDSPRELIVLNTHNSFYVKPDSLRKIELDIIISRMMEEYRKGNYVIAGGDWNQNPPGLRIKHFVSGDVFIPTHISIQPDFLPEGWKFAFDPENPTNRNVDQKYVRGTTPTTLIDYFIVSPNIDIVDVVTIPVGFKYTDHQPVYIRIQLQ